MPGEEVHAQERQETQGRAVGAADDADRLVYPFAAWAIVLAAVCLFVAYVVLLPILHQ